jgi:hypothetical protein
MGMITNYNLLLERYDFFIIFLDGSRAPVYHVCTILLKTRMVSKHVRRRIDLYPPGAEQTNVWKKKHCVNAVNGRATDRFGSLTV